MMWRGQFHSLSYRSPGNNDRQQWQLLLCTHTHSCQFCLTSWGTWSPGGSITSWWIPHSSHKDISLQLSSSPQTALSLSNVRVVVSELNRAALTVEACLLLSKLKKQVLLEWKRLGTIYNHPSFQGFGKPFNKFLCLQNSLSQSTQPFWWPALPLVLLQSYFSCD